MEALLTAPALELYLSGRHAKNSDTRLELLQALDHCPVEFAAVPRLVLYIRPATLADSEGANEVPQGPAPAGLFYSPSMSRIHARDTLCGVCWWTPHSPTNMPTPFFSSSCQGAISVWRIVSRSTILPSRSLSGQVGSGQLLSQWTHDAL